MTTVTKNFEYQGPDMPSDTICPPEENEHVRVRRLKATADNASVSVAGTLTYLTGGTNANDMTNCVDEYGVTNAQGKMYAVELMKHDPAFPSSTTAPEYPNKIPQSSITISDYAPAANTSIIVIPVEIGMRIWLVIGNAVNVSLVKDTLYNVAANGIIGSPADATPGAIVVNGHIFRAIATFTNSNWGFFEYMGMIGIDTTNN